MTKQAIGYTANCDPEQKTVESEKGREVMDVSQQLADAINILVDVIKGSEGLYKGITVTVNNKTGISTKLKY
jgi:hypothetical protein